MGITNKSGVNMKAFRIIRPIAVFLSYLGLLIPTAAFADLPTKLPTTRNVEKSVLDLAMSPGGALVGQLVDGQGKPLSERTVSVLQEGEIAITATTNASGRFDFLGLRGGSYHLLDGKNVYDCRLWAAGTAPPAAAKQLLLVDGPVARANDCCPGGLAHVARHNPGGAIMHTLSNPWVVGGLIAAAIAIPLALDDDSAS